MFKINKRLIYALIIITLCFTINFSPITKSYAEEENKEKTKVTENVKKEQLNTQKDKEYYTNTIKFIAKTSSGKPLDSGVWVIKDKENNILDTFNVSKDLYVFKKTLPKGEFFFQQQTPPNGYLKDNKVLTIKTPISLKNEGDSFEIYPKSTKKRPEESKKTPRESSETYKTGSIDLKYILIAFALIFSIVFLFDNSMKKKIKAGEKINE